MKRLYALILTLFVGINITLASEKIDSLSYAFGDMFTRSIMAGKNELMETKDDFADYIRGLEDYLYHSSQMNDSSYIMSYTLGALQGIFTSDGPINNLIPFDCIIAGLRKVGNKEISLPADTIAAMDFINRHGSDETSVLYLDNDTKYQFFTAYGIMKAYKIDLQNYINEMHPGSGYTADIAAFSTGMADMLEASTQPPKTPYDLGKTMAHSFVISTMSGYSGLIDTESLDINSFLAGAKAALGLGERFIPLDEVEKILNMPQGYEADNIVLDDDSFEELLEYIDKLEVEPFTKYQVNWKVTAGTVANEKTEVSNSFRKVVSKLHILDSQINGNLMATANDEDGNIYDMALTTIKEYPLPKGFKWFCRTTAEHLTILGIMHTDSCFSANVNVASVEYEPISGLVSMQWIYEGADALKWAEFTNANIGKSIAVEINGIFLFAPKVNHQITEGRCGIIGELTPEEINHFFKNATIMVNKKEPDTVTIIEME